MSKYRVYFWNNDYKDNHTLSEATLFTEGEWTEFHEDDELSLRVRTEDVIMVVKEE